jgi:hypothetical protein
MTMEENRYRKPGFDGRINYLQELHEIRNELDRCMYVENYSNCIRMMRLYLGKTGAFVRDDAKLLLKHDIEVVRLLQTRNHGRNQNRVTISFNNDKFLSLLYDLYDRLMNETKDLLLPTTGTDTENFDEDELIRGFNS